MSQGGVHGGVLAGGAEAERVLLVSLPEVRADVASSSKLALVLRESGGRSKSLRRIKRCLDVGGHLA